MLNGQGDLVVMREEKRAGVAQTKGAPSTSHRCSGSSRGLGRTNRQSTESPIVYREVYRERPSGGSEPRQVVGGLRQPPSACDAKSSARTACLARLWGGKEAKSGATDFGSGRPHTHFKRWTRTGQSSVARSLRAAFWRRSAPTWGGTAAGGIPLQVR